MPSCALAGPIRLAALGDSLTAGFGLRATEAFPAQLQAALAAKGYDVAIANCGISGDTSAGGLARLAAVLDAKPDGVILELGANDMLRGQDPETATQNLSAIMARLQQAGIPVMLCGMRSVKNYGSDYAATFNAIYPALAQKYRTVFYPFFLDGVTGQPGLTLPDGLHPNTKGVAEVVRRILPAVEAFLARIKTTTATP